MVRHQHPQARNRGTVETRLAVWDEHIDLLEPTPKHKIDRRAVLVKTFDELLRHALWNDNDHDDIVARLGTPSDPFERELLARALVGKAIALSRGGQREEAIAICEDVVARFGNASEPGLVERVAMAIFDKASTLKEAGLVEEAAAAYSALIGAPEHAEARHIVKRSEKLLAALK
jgi:hypothetical protein